MLCSKPHSWSGRQYLYLVARYLRKFRNSTDRRLMTLHGQVTPGRLAQLNRCMRGIRVGNFEPVQEQLHLGDALGNRFEITLR